MNLFSKLTAVTALSATIGLAVPGISHAAVGDQELSQGMQNKDVAQLQHILNDRGYLSHIETQGTYGAKTEAAVKSYQKNHHLNVDGIAGPKTFKTMNLKNTIGPEFLSKGNTGYDVTVLQDKLKELNYYNDKVDGKFGSLTRNALQDFQNDKGILVDGIVGPHTKSELGLKVVGNETAAKAANKETATTTTKATEKTTESKTEKAPAQPKQESKTKTTQDSKTKTKTEQKSSNDLQGKTITVSSTAYTANCAGCSGITATGINLKENSDAKVIAVDPSVIPLGSEVYVPGYGTAIAGDTGGAINGNKIDIFYSSKGQALDWGVKNIKVTILH